MKSTKGTFTEPKSIEFTKWLLIPLGLWPYMKEYKTKCEIIISIFLQFSCYSIILFTIIPALYHSIYREKDLSTQIELTCPLLFFAGNMLKYTILYNRREQIKKCIEHIKCDWQVISNDNEFDITMKNTLIGRKLTILCASFMYSGGLTYHTIVPFVVGSAGQTPDNRPIVFPGHDIAFNSMISPFYEIVFIGHVLVALVAYNILTACCHLAANFVTHACSQIQIVIFKLNCLFLIDDGNNESLKEKVADIVHRHARVLSFASDIERALREICLVEFLLSILEICWLEYGSLKSWLIEEQIIGGLVYFTICVSLSFNLFLFCYIGDLLKEQFFEAGISTYMIDWYGLPPNIATSLVLIISNAQIPRTITAGGLFELSLRSFASVMKTTFVYLNLFWTLLGY